MVDRLRLTSAGKKEKTMIAHIHFEAGDLFTLTESAALIEPNPALHRATARALIADLGEAALIPAPVAGF
ncbi:MAG: hypothetical protein E6R10_07220 [Rhodocyclaceae bacterium]|nr:MAG: hypothetical protein E6R10_07220 [Rhodocyclaceae bacterium]